MITPTTILGDILSVNREMDVGTNESRTLIPAKLRFHVRFVVLTSDSGDFNAPPERNFANKKPRLPRQPWHFDSFVIGRRTSLR